MKGPPTRSLVGGTGLAASLLIAVAVPLGHFAVSRDEAERNLRFKAELSAARTAAYIFAHEPRWQHHRARIAELIEYPPGRDEPIRQSVTDAAGGPVLQEGAAPPPPLLQVRVPVTVSGRTVAWLDAEASLRPLLLRSGQVAAASLLLAALAWTAFRLLPLRVLDRTLLALSSQSARFQAALDNMTQGLCLFDEKGRLVVYNRRFAAMFGPPATAAILAPPQAPPGPGGEDAAQELPDGRIIQVVRRTVPGQGWVATYDDITERRRHRTRIEEQAALLDLVRDGIVVRALDGRVRYANRAALGMLGLGGAEVAGMANEDLVRRVYERPDDFEAARRATIDTGRWSGRMAHRRADGSRFATEADWTLMRGEDGAPRAILVVGRDITERLALEARLRQSQRLEAVGQLTGGVAHDFNNILTVILGNAEAIAEALSPDDPLRPLAEMSIAAAERGAALTSRLLAFSRRQALEPRKVDVGATLAGLTLMLERILGARVELAVHAAPDLRAVLIDRPQLENAVLNLCVNARDAMPDGGSLVVEAVNLGAADAWPLPEMEPGRYVVIAVSDTGTGMSPEVAAQAFEPFFTTKPTGQGSGLGLSMVYGFIKQSGGHVDIASTPGLGTAVRLYLRALDEPAAAAPVPLPEAGGSERVLLVGDDAAVRGQVAGLLAGLGYAVTPAADAAEALALLRAGEAFDLLLSDAMMPGAMNGPDLAAEAGRLRPGLPTLLTSGGAEAATGPRRPLPAGTVLLSKTCHRRELAAAIRRALAGGAAPIPSTPVPSTPVPSAT